MPNNIIDSGFIKNEANYNFKNNSYGNYTGIGAKHSSKIGNIEALLAFKKTDSSIGGFLEGKYTTPKFLDDNIQIESRTRLVSDKPDESSHASFSLTQRVAAKGAIKLNNKFSIYEIAGVNANISLEGEGLKSLTPTSITGFNYDLNKKVCLYTEIELSKPYDCKKKSFEDLSTSGYIGVKIYM